MLNKKMTNRQSQAIKTKNKIYKVSIDLMKKHGFDNVTIQDISKKAGVSVGAFYHYFASKSDIFNEIYKQGDEYFQTHVASNLKGDNSIDKIIDFFAYYAKFNMSNGIGFVKQLYSTQNKLFIKKGRFMQTLLHEIIQEGQQKEEITNEFNYEKITDFLFMLARGVIFDWCLHDGEYNLEETLSDSMKSILKIYQTKI